MFSSRALLDRIAAVERLAGQQQATIQWLQATVNQLHAERSILLDRVLGLAIPAPLIAQVPGAMPLRQAAPDAPVPNQRSGDEPATPFDLVAAFEDMGDEEAARHNVRHTPDGFVTR